MCCGHTVKITTALHWKMRKSENINIVLFFRRNSIS